ncbi:MAG: hypothetical protein ACMZI0_05430 [Symbiopectobacterium sp.]|uniref:hypothetical protein n=1 Tax=Symbiopectobacterium sp. TaxID=2952789 RepID=UPI0039E9066F
MFRTTSHVEELKFASQAFNDKILDLKKTPLSCLTKILNNEFNKLIPIDVALAEKMIAQPANAAKLLHQKIKEMHPIEEKLLSKSLELYSDAYKNAEDDENSSFNKRVVLFSLTHFF